MAPRIVAEMPDGSVQIITPSPWALLRLQRGHAEFDSVAAAADLRKSGLSEREVSDASDVRVDLEREEQKLRANPANTDERIKGYLALHAAANEGGKSLDESIALIMAKDWSHVVRWKVVDSDTVPNSSEAHRIFRNALRYDLTHDIEKCRELHRDHQANLALKRENQKRKQALRDAVNQPSIDKAQTIDDLMAIK